MKKLLKKYIGYFIKLLTKKSEKINNITDKECCDAIVRQLADFGYTVTKIETCE